jgi:hypothetical protein
MFNCEIAKKKYEWFANKYNINIAIETGTHQAMGALNLSKYHDIVITCEISDKYFNESSNNIKGNPDKYHIEPGYTLVSTFNTIHNNLLVNLYQKDNKKIYMIKGSSEIVLDDILNGGLGFDVNKNLLFYLDAHWNDYWPLKDELKLIKKYNLSDSKIIIHDFYVPGFTERIVDEYGNTHFIWGCDSYYDEIINFDYVKDLLFDINPGMLSYFADDVVYNNAGRGILYSVPPEEQNFNEHLEFNRGIPCIEINSEYYSAEDIESSKIQKFKYKKLTKGIDY